MTKSFEFEVPIYGATVTVQVASDFNAAMTRFHGTEHTDTDAQGIVSWKGKHFLLLVKPEYRRDIQVICHEIYHLTNKILYHFGVDADFDNDEAGAYLHDFLAGKILTRLLFR